MWKCVRATVTSSFRFITARTFLSNAYKCTDDWNARLAAPVLQKIKPELFYYELEQKFQHHGKCSAIDIDIFANRLTDYGYLEEVADLVHRQRLTEETTNTFESTGHALIRCYLDHAENTDLLDILNDRLSYGVFLDSFTANLSLDKFIQAKDFTSAAKIASFMMLQEDFTNPITRALSLYACVKYLQNVQPFEVPAIDTSASEEVVAATSKTPASKKKKEEIRVRVAFLRNEYFDDHFDLRDGQKLVGKTLTMIGNSFGSTDIGRTAQLLGLYNFGKYAQATKLLIGDSSGFYKNVVDAIVAQTDAVTDSADVEFSKFAETLKTLATGGKCLPDDFEKVVCGLAHNIVAEQETADITAQKKVYADWCELREEKLAEELERLKRKQRLEEIERVTSDMEAEEQRLWFFENEDQIDLKIDSKQVRYRKRWFGKKKKPRVIDEGYIPPEIQVQRNK